MIHIRNNSIRSRYNYKEFSFFIYFELSVVMHSLNIHDE